MPTTNYQDFLNERLNDPEYAAGYLSACAEEGEDVLLLGIRDVAEARGGMKKLAELAQLNRAGLYRSFAEEGNPKLSSFIAVLDTLGIELQFAAKSTG